MAFYHNDAQTKHGIHLQSTPYLLRFKGNLAVRVLWSKWGGPMFRKP